MIPSENEIRRALLMELYACKDHASTPENMYNELVNYFEEQLEDSEFEPYRNSKNKWANEIQWTRQHLVNEGLILSAKQNKRNEWKLSDSGIRIGRELYIKAYGDDPWAAREVTIENIPDTVVQQLQDKEEDEAFPEGKEKYRLHHSKERNAKLVALKKKKAMDINPLLPCEICQTSFKEKYGEVGNGFIEAHHITPISDLTEETETRLEDLILVCSNCHKIIHRKRPWLTVEQMKNLLTSNQ